VPAGQIRSPHVQIQAVLVVVAHQERAVSGRGWCPGGDAAVEQRIYRRASPTARLDAVTVDVARRQRRRSELAACHMSMNYL